MQTFSSFDRRGRQIRVSVPGAPETHLPILCPGCSGIVKRDLGLPVGLGRCADCGGLIGEVTYDTFHALLRSLESWCSCGSDRRGERYFDLTIVDAVPAPQRFHGWYCTDCSKMTQEG